jgi:hypothetical protein
METGEVNTSTQVSRDDLEKKAKEAAQCVAVSGEGNISDLANQYRTQLQGA